MKFDTVKEAAVEFVKEFNAFPTDMISYLMKHDIDSWSEVTRPAQYDSVYVYDTPDEIDSLEHGGEIKYYDKDEDVYHIRLYDENEIVCCENEFDVEYNGALPMWGTMWQFSDPCDTHWMENEDGVFIMSQLGFRIYYHEEWGYFFGIDSAGFDFYKVFWIPLYEARGLQWHKTSN